jgi:hypothetical protein
MPSHPDSFLREADHFFDQPSDLKWKPCDQGMEQYLKIRVSDEEIDQQECHDRQEGDLYRHLRKKIFPERHRENQGENRRRPQTDEPIEYDRRDRSGFGSRFLGQPEPAVRITPDSRRKKIIDKSSRQIGEKSLDDGEMEHLVLVFRDHLPLARRDEVSRELKRHIYHDENRRHPPQFFENDPPIHLLDQPGYQSDRDRDFHHKQNILFHNTSGRRAFRAVRPLMVI